jgi:hypothetical protein
MMVVWFIDRFCPRGKLLQTSISCGVDKNTKVFFYNFKFPLFVFKLFKLICYVEHVSIHLTPLLIFKQVSFQNDLVLDWKLFKTNVCWRFLRSLNTIDKRSGYEKAIDWQ